MRREAKKWMRQGPHFGPRSLPPSTRPEDAYCIKRGMPRRYGGRVIDGHVYGGEAQLTVGGIEGSWEEDESV